MIKSIKGTNGFAASLGNIQVQPVDDDASKLSSSKTTKSFKQTKLSMTTTKSSGGNVTSGIKHTVETLVAATSDGVSIVPMVPTRGTSTVPSFYDSSKRNVPPSTLPQFNVGQRRLDPYEQLTGISHVRPEIVMVTDFEPLYDLSTRNNHSSHSLIKADIDRTLTAAGEYVDMQFQMRSMQHETIKSMITSLVSNFKTVSDAVLTRRQDCVNELNQLRDVTDFLLRVVRDIETLKKVLDLHDERHVIDVTNVIRTHTLNYTRVNTRSSVNVLNDYASRYIPSKFSFIDALVSIGYDRNAVSNIFSSSKMWCQLLLEMRSMLLGHSRSLLDETNSSQRNDRNAIVLTVPHKTFRLPSVSTRLDDIGTTKVKDVELAIAKLSVDWKKFDQPTSRFVSNETRVSTLLNALCKEYRYSTSLSDGNFAKFVSDEFAYDVNVGSNDALFDKIIGDISTNVTSINASASSTSLDAVGRHSPADNVSVLTFETKYVENDAGITTPGSAYYVDSLLDVVSGKFNLKNITQLQRLIEQEHRRFNYVVDGMNLLGVNVVSDTESLSTKYSSTLSNAAEFVNEIFDLIVNKSGQTLQRTYDDPLCPVYSFAASDEKLRSALFMYTIVKLLKQNSTISTLFSIIIPNGTDNAPLLEKIIDVMIDRLENAVQTTTSGAQSIVNSAFNYNKSTTVISIETLRSAFRTGTRFSTSVEALVQKVLATFLHDNVAIVDDVSRHSGVNSCALMMALFDSILSTVVMTSNQTITSINVGQIGVLTGTKTFNVSKGSTNHIDKVNNVISRLQSESARVQMIVYAVLGTLRSVSDSLLSMINFVSSRFAETTMDYVSSVVDDNDMLRMLLNEQQILLLASTLHDMTTLASGDDPFVVLDNNVTSSKMKNVIFGSFNSAQYASSKGNNKRIFTVGVPVGLSQRLQQKIDARRPRASLASKEKDIISIAVYKVDVRHPDIIFRPQRFLFELSRFPVRDDSAIMNVDRDSTFETIVKSVPTRDMLQTQNSNDVTYRSIDGSVLPDGVKRAFDGKTYDFLTDAQKDELTTNHVMSYVAESYIKLLTSIDVGEHHFHAVEQLHPVDDQLVKLVNEHQIVHVTSTLSAEGKKQSNSPGVLFTSIVGGSKPKNEGGSSLDVLSDPKSVVDAGSGGSALDVVGKAVGNVKQSALNVLTNPASVLNNASNKSLDAVVASQAAINSVGRLVSTMAHPSNLSRLLLTPKQFDRVFNVIIDPDEFDVDDVETLKTQSGKQMLEQLLKNGDIVTVEKQEGASTIFKHSMRTVVPRSGQFKMTGKDKQSGDITFDKYFVAIETLNAGDVV